MPSPHDITPFTLDVPTGELDDLRSRLRATRWPEAETVDDSSQGARLEQMKTLVEHWADGYDWRRTEARLNEWGQLTTVIDGLEIHFLHVRSSVPGARAVLLTHGWPGSVLEFRHAIGPLTEPVGHGGSAADAYDVVIPSVPGFGFSGRPQSTGWTIERVARAWYTMMQDVAGTHDEHGHLGGLLPLDEIIDTLMLYWLPRTGASAARIYWESTRAGWSSNGTADSPVTVPAGVTIMPGSHSRRSRRWAERRYLDLVHFSEASRGGHFAFIEQPERLVEDVRATFRLL